jgi:pimeloyl-ACP methyl ester carboxylesterase
MTAGQAQDFVNRYQIIDHRSNDSSGFSATLLFDTQTQQYTLSFRSTEYLNASQGGDFVRDGLGAGASIKLSGFAFAQVDAMERYYNDVVKPLIGSTPLNVTGYSLGGHLATVFTELHADAINHTYVFNGAGRGAVRAGNTVANVISAHHKKMSPTLRSPHARARANGYSGRVRA